MIARPLVVLPIDTVETDDPGLQLVIDAQREIGVRTAIGFLVAGNRGRAHTEIVRSVLRQWRLAFNDSMPLEPSPAPRRGESVR